MDDAWCISKATEASNDMGDDCWIWMRRYYQLLANEWLVPDGAAWLINLPKLVDDVFLDLEKLIYTVSVATRFLFGLGLSDVTLGITGWEELLGLLRVAKWSEEEYNLSRRVSSLMASAAGATAKILVDNFSGYAKQFQQFSQPTRAVKVKEDVE